MRELVVAHQVRALRALACARPAQHEEQCDVGGRKVGVSFFGAAICAGVVVGGISVPVGRYLSVRFVVNSEMGWMVCK